MVQSTSIFYSFSRFGLELLTRLYNLFRAGPPEIDCKKQMVATAGIPFNMTCSIESLVPMDIVMYKRGSSQRHTLRYR